MKSSSPRESSSQCGSSWSILGSICWCQFDFPTNAFFGVTGNTTTLHGFSRFVLLLKSSEKVR